MNHQSRLRWRCRRGIREMDILLERFLDECYPSLTEAERVILGKLVEEADLDLLDWITGRRPPFEPAYEPLIRRLQELKPGPPE